MRQLTNAFYIQSPRLQNAPILATRKYGMMRARSRRDIAGDRWCESVSSDVRGHSTSIMYPLLDSFRTFVRESDTREP